ncbi:MAG: flavin reductase family protein [Chloroflexi bacterium]|nr:flavin reductase family protein [Chloroflexota bacterium]
MRTIVDTGAYGEYLHYGLPLTLVTVQGPDGRVNVSTNASIAPLPGDENRLAMGVLKVNYTNELIAQSREFAVNVLTSEMRAIARQCGYISGTEVDKLALCGLTTIPARYIGAPLIEQCPLNIECRVEDVHDLGDIDLWIAKILAVEVDEAWSNGRGGVNLQHYDLLIYAFGHTFKLGPMVGLGGL